MSNTVQTRFRRSLPGNGVDSAGNPVQGKVEVTGQITVTSYDRGGESLTPADVHLRNIDWIDIKHENSAGGKEGSEPRDVRYNFTTQDFYIRETEGPANAGAHTLVFRATGDTANAPELL